MPTASLSAERTHPRAAPLAAVFGCAGPALTPWERDFFRDADPLGFILFGRNLGDAAGIRRLTAELRDAVGDADAPVLIDQEGGRVARLGPPDWPAFPSAACLAKGPVAATRATARAIGEMLAGLGIDVNCAPVADVHAPGLTHAVIGERAFSSDPAIVAAHARAYAEGLAEARVLPVLKHLPGHGRAVGDSHETLPETDADEASVAAFSALADLPLGMTAHVRYRDWDAQLPATLSPAVIGNIVRGRIGFDGLLLTDDLSMRALDGPLGARAHRALDAGCDIALHCNADPVEMAAVAAAAGRMTAAAAEHWRRARNWLEAL